MTANSITGESRRGNLFDQSDLVLSLSQALGGRTPGYVSPDNAFHQGLRSIVSSLKEGSLTQEQAALLIELLLAGYVGTTINLQIDDIFQAWANHMTAASLGTESGRR